MRNRLVVCAAFISLLATSAFAQNKSLVLNTAHDLRTNKTVGDACIACHTPHNANSGYQALLWVRAIRPNGPATSPFQFYDTTVNADFKGGTVNLAGGNQVSLLCLSCHDGGAALNISWTGATNSTLSSGFASSSAVGSDLRNDHPIGFVYATTVTAKPLDYNAANATTGVVSGNVKVFAGRVECASCHNVHSNANSDFLVQANTNSALCLACHK